MKMRQAWCGRNVTRPCCVYMCVYTRAVRTCVYPQSSNATWTSPPSRSCSAGVCPCTISQHSAVFDPLCLWVLLLQLGEHSAVFFAQLCLCALAPAYVLWHHLSEHSAFSWPSSACVCSCSIPASTRQCFPPSSTCVCSCTISLSTLHFFDPACLHVLLHLREHFATSFFSAWFVLLAVLQTLFLASHWLLTPVSNDHTGTRQSIPGVGSPTNHSFRGNSLGLG